MSPNIRPARPDDTGAIAAFTTATFSWGDYVGEEFPNWFDDPDVCVAVVTDEGDSPVAVARVKMLGPREGWLSAARVHPDHRRRGLGSALNDWCVGWVSSQGGLVCRLQIETDNEPAHNQVLQLGYRLVMAALNVERPTRLPPDSNGAKHSRPPERLQRAPRAESDLAFMAWSTGDLARRARGMFAVEPWAWRRLQELDIRSGVLWVCPFGWILTDEFDEELHVRWLTCSPDDAGSLLSAVIDLAREREKSSISMAVPDVDWLTTIVGRLGFITSHPSRIYEKSLPLT
ncbi:MAG: GNAT family N-acetyltransferase [Acidimicrobiia bacterium]